MRLQIIQAAVALMQEGGHVEVTAGRLAKAVGLSRQSIHYHFGTMDEVLVAAMRYGLELALGEFEQALHSEEPLRQLWMMSSQASHQIAFFEFRAAALRSVAMREAIRELYDRLRDMQIKIIERHFELRGAKPPIAPTIAAVLVPAVMYEVTFERAMGVSRGHDELLAYLDKWVEDFAATKVELA
jgi:AcrR family transcriptional regulator